MVTNPSCRIGESKWREQKELLIALVCSFFKSSAAAETVLGHADCMAGTLLKLSARWVWKRLTPNWDHLLALSAKMTKGGLKLWGDEW